MHSYVKNIGALIADAQITNGGPVILVQAENEYDYDESKGDPSPGYFGDVIQQLRDAGITVPITNNNAGINGNNAPGYNAGQVVKNVSEHQASTRRPHIPWRSSALRTAQGVQDANTVRGVTRRPSCVLVSRS